MLCHLDEQRAARGRRGPGHEPRHGAGPPVPRPAQAARGAGRPAMKRLVRRPSRRRRPCACWHWIPARPTPPARRTWRRASAARRRAATAARGLDELPRRRRGAADAAFSAADLEPDSSARLLARLGRGHRAARVLPFPGHPCPAGAAPGRSPLAGRRGRRRPGPGSARRTAAAPWRLARSPTGRTTAPWPSRPDRRSPSDARPLEDTLLSEVEAALDPDAASGAARPRRADARALRDPVAALVPSLIFKKGLDLKHEVAGELAESYHSALVAAIKANDYRYELRAGSPCTWPASSASATASIAPSTTPTRRGSSSPTGGSSSPARSSTIPHVNDRLRGAGHPLPERPRRVGERPHRRRRRHPAGLRRHHRRAARLDAIGCTLVDTTCGSVLNVWKNVKRYAQDGFTSVIHGKHWHEETQATASQAVQVSGGHYLVVLDRDRGRPWSATSSPARRRPGPRGAPASVPRRRVARLRPRSCTWPGSAAPTRRRCSAASRSRSARCSATAMSARARRGRRRPSASAPSTPSAAPPRTARTPSSGCSPTHALDLMLVVGGYNSSNTCNLARICAARVPTFHIADPDGLLSPPTPSGTATSPPGPRWSRATGCRAAARSPSASPPAPPRPTTSSRPSSAPLERFAAAA